MVVVKFFFTIQDRLLLNCGLNLNFHRLKAKLQAIYKLKIYTG